MKTSYIFGAAVAAGSLSGMVERAEAATIAAFTFETSGVALTGSTATGSSYSVAADFGVGSMLVKHLGAAGTASTYTSPAGNGSPRSFSSSGWGGGDTYTFSVPTTGYKDIVISFDMKSDAGGPTSFIIRESKDATNFTYYAGDNANPTTSFKSFSDDYSGGFLPALDNNSLAAFQLQENQGPAAGANYIDNFVVTGTAVPEPATMGLALVAVGGLLKRRLR